MTPTRADVITLAQFLLGDATGQAFVDGGASAAQIDISQAFVNAYQALVSDFVANQVPKAIFSAFYTLPANTGQLSPAQAGISDFSELVLLEERQVGNSIAITTCNTSSPITATTATPHGLSDGTEVIITGVGGQTGANGRWLITVTGASTFTLNGSTSVAAYTSGGTVTTSPYGYTPVIEIDVLPVLTLPQVLGYYVWQNNIWNFVGCSMARQLRITYQGSGAAPASGTVGIDDSLNTLAYRTAAIAGGSVDMDRAAALAADANAYQSMLVQKAVRVMQKNPKRNQPYKAGRLGNRPYYAPIIVA